MLVILYVLLVLFLGLIFWEDFTSRLVNILYFIALAIIASVIFMLQNGVVKNMVFSLCFLLLNLLGVKMYTIMKKGANNVGFFEIPDLAEGDILFFLTVIPLFSFFNYIAFFISGLLVSLVIHLLVKVSIDKRNTIPLAGYMALYLVGIVLYSQISDTNLYINLSF